MQFRGISLPVLGSISGSDPPRFHPSLPNSQTPPMGFCVVQRLRGRRSFPLCLRAPWSVKPLSRVCGVDSVLTLRSLFFSHFSFFFFPPFAMCYGHLALSQPLAAARPHPARGTPCPSLQTPLDPLSMASRCKNPAPVASSENCNFPGAAGARLGPSTSVPVS